MCWADPRPQEGEGLLDDFEWVGVKGETCRSKVGGEWEETMS